MHEAIISNIRNVLIWGKKEEFSTEIHELELAGVFNVFQVETMDEFSQTLATHLIHLIVIDSNSGIEIIRSLKTFLYKNEYASIPMLLAMESEIIDERCDYFTHGVSSFYAKGSSEYFFDSVIKIDRDYTFKEGLKSMSIAVLDDDRLQLAIIKDMLLRNQIYNVDFFKNPKELLDVKEKYDVYLIDLILPDIDGEIVMLEMRKKNENAVIIGISSIEKKSTIARVLSIGANDYITKPVNEQVFMAKLYSNARVLMLLNENELKKKMLEELAIKDGLTSLYNHKHIHEILDANIKMANRYSRPLSLLMMDIDNFKRVNDTYGHQFGDLVLAKVAEIISETVRESDIVGRYGGEEFIIILPETECDEAYILGERVREKISKWIFNHDVTVTISGGASQLLTDSEQLIYDADQLLYFAKNTGKNKIEVAKINKESYLSS